MTGRTGWAVAQPYRDTFSDRVLRKRLTILELRLHSQVLPQQIHHHGLHVASDATSVPRQIEVSTEQPERLTLLNNRLLNNKPRAQIDFPYFSLNCFPSEYWAGQRPAYNQLTRLTQILNLKEIWLKTRFFYKEKEKKKATKNHLIALPNNKLVQLPLVSRNDYHTREMAKRELKSL